MKKSILKGCAWGLSSVYFFLCYFHLFTLNVHAYVDPSVVTYLVQAVAGVFIALGAVATIFRHKIAAFFKKGKKTDDAQEDKIEMKDVED